jgi:hypothetical protein
VKPLAGGGSRLARGLACAAAVAVVALPLLVDPHVALPGRPSAGGPFRVGAGAFVAAGLLAIGLLRRRAGAGAPAVPLELGLAAALGLYLVYVGNGVFLGSGDSLSTRYLPSVLLREGTLDLSGAPPFRSRETWHYSVLWLGERTLPSFPLGTAFLALPYTGLALALQGGAPDGELLLRLEKHLSALLAVASTALLFGALRPRVGPAAAAAASALFALASPLVTYSSQALWSTTGELFCIALALFWLLPPRPGAWAAPAAGVAMGMAFLCRPTALLALGALGTALALREPRRARGFLAGAALALAAVTLLHQLAYGHPLGGYGLVNARPELYRADPAAGLLGLLASPSRGLLFFLPWVASLAFGWRFVARDPQLRPWCAAALAASALGGGLAASYVKWWGGHSVGPRLLIEASPFLALLAAPLFARWRSLPVGLRAATLAAALFAGATQLRAAYGSGAWQWSAAVDVDVHPEVLWSWRNGQLAAIWWPGWQFRLAPEEVAGLEEVAVETGRFRRVDLAAVANARYDQDPFRPGAEHPPRFARLDPDALNRPRAPFHFGPRGAPNVVSTAAPGGAPAIPLPGLRAERLHLLLSADASPGAEPAEVARLELVYADGAREELALRLHREVFPYDPDPFKAPLPPERLYFGRPAGHQALARTTLEPSRPEALLASVRLRGRPAGPAVALFALTVEGPGHST